MADDSKNKEYKLVEEKIKEMKPIHDRMDEDEKLYLLDPYKMKKLPPYDAKVEKEVANITLPDPLLYANKVMSIIGGATRQPVIKGRDLKDKKTTKIEVFTDDMFYLVNERLVRRGLVSLDSFIIEQICLRGRIDGRCGIELDDEGNIVANVLPVDARHFVCEHDDEGMPWGAAISSRPASYVEREYGEKYATGAKNGLIRVIDFWNPEQNTVYTGNSIALEQENTYGYTPFVESICPVGSMLTSEDAAMHQGESIFWPNRKLWPEKNRTATILQTLNVQSLFANLQYESSKGEQAEQLEETPYAVETVFPIEKGMGFKAMPVRDMKNATRMFYSILESALQKGSLTALDYGNLTFPLSAIAYTEITSGRNDSILPRIQGIALWYQLLTRMIINQCIALNKTIKLGQPGQQNTYSKSDLGGDFTIGYRFFTKSKEQDIADLSIANAARGFLPEDYIRREILKLPNPDGTKVEFESEQAERIDEVLLLYRRASSLLDVEKPTEEAQIEAYILADRAVTILRQRKAMGKLSPIEGQAKGAEPTGKELLPLLSEGGKDATPSRTKGELEEEPTEAEETEIGKV